MEIWIIMGLPIAGIIFLLDYLLRRKKWRDNTREEKAGLLLNMISVVPYMIFSAFGILMGITGNGTETALGNAIYEVTIALAEIYFIVALAAIIGTLILRKIGKNKASIWLNVGALVYIIVVAFVNYFANELL